MPGVGFHRAMTLLANAATGLLVVERYDDDNRPQHVITLPTGGPLDESDVAALGRMCHTGFLWLDRPQQKYQITPYGRERLDIDWPTWETVMKDLIRSADQ